jgi:uncharacterized protein (DUF486 family)
MRKLSKTFKPEGFNKLKVSQLKRFADIFNIPVFSLFQTFLIKDEDHEKLELQQAATDNELYHITIINLK